LWGWNIKIKTKIKENILKRPFNLNFVLCISHMEKLLSYKILDLKERPSFFCTRLKIIINKAVVVVD